MTKTAKATKTQQTTLRLIDGQQVSWPAERFVVNAIIASLDNGWIASKHGNENGISCQIEDYALTDAGRALI